MVQRSRVMETLRLVDPAGTICHGLGINIIPRRVYSVPAPVALWHIDGNHKLIQSVFHKKFFFKNVIRDEYFLLHNKEVYLFFSVLLEKLCTSLQVMIIEPPLLSRLFLELSISLEFQQGSVVIKEGRM